MPLQARPKSMHSVAKCGHKVSEVGLAGNGNAIFVWFYYLEPPLYNVMVDTGNNSAVLKIISP